jgi:hypothetical protein
MAVGGDLPVRRSAASWTGSRSRDAPPQWRYSDRSRLVALAAGRCRRLEPRPADHRLCSFRQLRDRAVGRVARGSHLRGSPGRVWGHLRGDRATTRRRGRRAARCTSRSARPSNRSTPPRAIALWGLGPLARADIAITPRRDRRPRARGEARDPRTTQSRPLRRSAATVGYSRSRAARPRCAGSSASCRSTDSCRSTAIRDEHTQHKSAALA